MNRNVFITGATSGFGKAIAYKFAAQNDHLILCGRRMERLLDIKNELESKYGVLVRVFSFDIQDKNQIDEALDTWLVSNPRVDILVNNAGLAAGLSSIEEGSLDDWERMIDTNVKGLLYISRKILPILKQQRSGHIFNISSTAGKIVYKNGNVYCATKHAVDALSQSMRIDLLPYGIKVTCISPGMAETEFSLVRFNGNEEKAKQVYTDTEPLQAHDIADTVAYCANLPAHVCINDLTITCLNQANGIYVQKNADKL